MPHPAVLPLLVGIAPGSAAVAGDFPGNRSLYLLAAAIVAGYQLVACCPAVAEAVPGTAEAAGAAAAVVGEEAGSTAAAAGAVVAASAAGAPEEAAEGVGRTVAAAAADIQVAAADDTQEGIGTLAVAAADTRVPPAGNWEDAAVAHTSGLLHSKLAAAVAAAAARLARTHTAQQGEGQHSCQLVVAAADSLAAAAEVVVVVAVVGTAGETASVGQEAAVRPR